MILKGWQKKDNETGRAAGSEGRNLLGSRERSLLSETVQIEEELLPAYVRPMLGIIAITVVAFFFWAGLTNVKEVARAPGEIVPVGKIKVVQHLDGGVIAEIPVEERMLVEEGQVLLRIDGSQATADLRQMEARLVALTLRAERISAFAEDRPPDLAPLAGNHADLLTGQQELYRQQIETRKSTLSILDHQINQRMQRLVQQEKALSAAREQQALSADLLRMREELAARRLVNRTVLLETRRAKVTADGEVARLREEIDVNQQELAEVRTRRADTENQLRRDALNELGSVRAEMAEVEETLQRLQARVDRLVIRAPHSGYIQDLKVQTVGQVIQPGALLMQLVPDQAPLEAEIRIAPKDVGHVRTGQRVNLRITSYDYTRFGYATGELKRISASSVASEDGRTHYYRAWVTLDRPSVGDTPGRYLLQAGMSLEADIVTGEKTLLTYLTKPIIDVVSRSFQER
ncbi:HlyD family type I secretion periplasmic adaptor subunit [Thauera aromatica]|uniref:Membrane fusion protein (MFP) family protein n=1 Tax=Thauera aromatica K172 TaxID=44139 RepID=A0A2R4BQ08_THAAR|nr:HlyD family type I secretion periplasmic adaptor subunit [Thauera aromatica]AVR89360.1 HlyD family secretion protein [Thauera aromatica K172]